MVPPELLIIYTLISQTWEKTNRRNQSRQRIIKTQRFIDVLVKLKYNSRVLGALLHILKSFWHVASQALGWALLGFSVVCWWQTDGWDLQLWSEDLRSPPTCLTTWQIGKRCGRAAIHFTPGPRLNWDGISFTHPFSLSTSSVSMMFLLIHCIAPVCVCD